MGELEQPGLFGVNNHRNSYDWQAPPVRNVSKTPGLPQEENLRRRIVCPVAYLDLRISHCRSQWGRPAILNPRAVPHGPNNCLLAGLEEFVVRNGRGNLA